MDAMTRKRIRHLRDRQARGRLTGRKAGYHLDDPKPTPDIPGTWLLHVRKPRTQIHAVPWMDDGRDTW